MLTEQATVDLDTTDMEIYGRLKTRRRIQQSGAAGRSAACFGLGGDNDGVGGGYLLRVTAGKHSNLVRRARLRMSGRSSAELLAVPLVVAMPPSVGAPVGQDVGQPTRPSTRTFPPVCPRPSSGRSCAAATVSPA